MDRGNFLRDTASLLAAAKGVKSLEVRISIPDSDGLNLSGTVPITVAVQPVSNLRFVHILLDGTKVAEGTGSPFTYQWDTTKSSNGTHVIKATAFYKTRKSEGQLAVTVNNAAVPPPPPTLGRGIGYLRLGDGIIKSNPEKYDLLALTRNAWPQPDRGNRLITYFSVMDCTDAVYPNHYGVGQQEARDAGWLLKDSGGNEIVCPSFPDVKLGDIGNDAYLARWCQNVEAIMTQFSPVEGFYSDNIMNWGRFMGWSANVVPVKYPNQQAWDDAMIHAIEYVYNYFHPKGRYVGYNCNAWLSGDEESNNGMRLARWWARCGPHADALMCEYWMHLSPWGLGIRKVGTAWSANWDAYRNLHGFCNGKPFPVTGGQVQLSRPIDFIGLDEFTTAQRAQETYCMATFLLDYERPGSVFMPHIQTGDEWYADMDKLPLTFDGPAVKSGNAWIRTATDGRRVVVDPVAGTASIA